MRIAFVFLQGLLVPDTSPQEAEQGEEMAVDPEQGGSEEELPEETEPPGVALQPGVNLFPHINYNPEDADSGGETDDDEPRDISLGSSSSVSPPLSASSGL